MKVSEFIKLWGELYKLTTPISYYYNNKNTTLYELYTNNDAITSINLKVTSCELLPEQVEIVHNTKTADLFTYDETNFYSKLSVELPEGATIHTINMYIN